jgi:hypothetical protein
MTDPETLARNRYFLMTGTRIASAAGAMMGLVLMGRATQWHLQLLGGAIVLSALYVMATVPRALARRWRTPPQP